MKINPIQYRLFVFILTSFLCFSATMSCGHLGKTVNFTYDELSQNLDRIEIVNITTVRNPYTTNIETVEVLDDETQESVLREIASMDFHVMIGSPLPLEGKGLIIYDDTFRLIITSTVICKEYLNDTSPELSSGEFWYEISTGGAFDKLLAEIT